MARPDIPGYEGVQFLTGSRDAWGFDDTANYLKHGLCQIEVDRKNAIADRYDRDREIPKDALRDPWDPLRELTSNLLPHLAFERIDASNQSQVRVLWKVHAKDTIVDLDDLSSGERSIIQIFYPLVEARIKNILRDIQHADATKSDPEICVLIDEPELHLHPTLQVKVFDYLRSLTTASRMQVILATHSPTIVEYASFEELFLIRPVEVVAAGDNQLVQVATNEERLQFLRSLFGTTSNLTALQPVIIVEGVEQHDRSHTVSDRKLYRALHPGFDRINLVAGGGKADCLRLRKVLDEALYSFAPQISAVALLDRDLAEGTPPDGVSYLPVSMIENFLLDPRAVWETIQSVLEKTSFKSVDDVGAAIDSLLDEMTQAEIERRAIRAIGRRLFQPAVPLTTIPDQVAAFTSDLVSSTTEEAVQQLTDTAERQVADLKATSRRREHFHGKDVLTSFYKRHLHSTGMATSIFTYETARHARARKKVVQFFDQFFAGALPEIHAPIIVGSHNTTSEAKT